MHELVLLEVEGSTHSGEQEATFNISSNAMPNDDIPSIAPRCMPNMSNFKSSGSLYVSSLRVGERGSQ